MKFLALVLGCLAVVGHVSCISDYYMDNYCGQTLDITADDAIRLQLTVWSTYKPNMDCRVTIRTSSLDRMMVYFRSFSVESSITCDDDWLELHDGSSISSSNLASNSRYCGTTYPYGILKTSGNYLTLRFRSDSSVQRSGFDMIITSYHTGFCDITEYTCTNGRCIDESETCNGYNPCGDYSDCDGSITVVATGVIAGSVVGGITFLIVIAVIILIVVRRRRVGLVVRQNVGPQVTTVQSTAGVVSPPPQPYPGPYNNPGSYNNPAAYGGSGTYGQPTGY